VGSRRHRGGFAFINARCDPDFVRGNAGWAASNSDPDVRDSALAK
jgi:hypothetical protein